MLRGILKKFVCAFGAIVLVFTLTGCSSNKNTTSQAMTLYWWRSSEDAPSAVLQDVVDAFEKNNPSVKIEIVLKDPRTFEQEALSALAGAQNVTNAPDILSIKDEDLPRYIPQLVPAPNDIYDQALPAKKKTGKSVVESVNELFMPVVSKSVTFSSSDDKPLIYGLPLGLDTLALYRNTELLSNAADRLKQENKVDKDITPDQLNLLKKKITSAPKTWTDLADIIPYVTVKSGADITRGAIALGMGNNVERSYDILQSMMMQNGTEMTSSDLNSATFNQTQQTATGTKNLGLESLNFYLRFSNPNDPLYSWNSSMEESVSAFENEKVAMMIQYASAYRFIINEAPQIKKKIDVSPFLQISASADNTNTDSLKVASRMWVEAATASRGDKNRQNAAWAFISQITSKTGSKPYLSAMKISSALKDGTEKVKFKAFSDQKPYADTWYKGHKAAEIDQAFISMIDKSAQNRNAAASALNEAANLATTILKASLAKWYTKSGN